jgi:hypothetical protein
MSSAGLSVLTVAQAAKGISGIPGTRASMGTGILYGMMTLPIFPEAVTKRLKQPVSMLPE